MTEWTQFTSNSVHQCFAIIFADTTLDQMKFCRRVIVFVSKYNLSLYLTNASSFIHNYFFLFYKFTLLWFSIDCDNSLSSSSEHLTIKDRTMKQLNNCVQLLHYWRLIIKIYMINQKLEITQILQIYHQITRSTFKE